MARKKITPKEFAEQAAGVRLSAHEKLCAERMKVLSSLKPIKGWKVRGCFHSKQADPTSVGEYMYCEHCDKDANQMWMIYNYDNETWSLKEQNWHDVCGTPFNFKK